MNQLFGLQHRRGRSSAKCIVGVCEVCLRCTKHICWKGKMGFEFGEFDYC